MKKFAVGILVMGFAATTAFGGVVGFDPVVAGVLPGEDAVFNISVDSTDAATFEAVNLLIGSADGLLMDFEYAQSFIDSTSLPPAAPSAFGVYSTDLFGAGNNFSGWSAPLLVGTLTVDTTGLSMGESYDILVSASNEMNMIGTALSNVLVNGSTGETEDLNGMGTVRIVPEPATLALLTLGGVGLLRRRK